MLKGTRLRPLVREFLGSFKRECKIALTPAPRPAKWVFVVGCYNSGTTLLAEVLGRHPQIAALPTEGQFLTDQLPKDYEHGVPRMWVEREDLFRMDERSSGPDVVRLKKEWAIRLDTRRPVLLEKSPPNAARTRWLQAHFEAAHFIAIVRNGYAVAEGIRRKAEPRHQPSGRWPIEMAARQWARSNEILMEDGVHLERLLWVRYEDLTADLGTSLRSIVDFLGIDWDPGIASKRHFAVHERRGPVQNLNDSSIARLADHEIDAITAVARPWLEQFDYPILAAPRVPT